MISKATKYLSDHKIKYPNCCIRLIAHSLGAKVVEGALKTLNNNETWKNNSDYSVTSIHLIGAAISDRSTSKKRPFGIAIDNIVNNFYNLYNPIDNILQSLYIRTENENPLGLLGLNKEESFPQRYMEHNVISEIAPLLKKTSKIYKPFIDNTIYGGGSNQSGYIGVRDINRKLSNNGSINVIVADWKRN